jgi:hypothetical protein
MSTPCKHEELKQFTFADGKVIKCCSMTWQVCYFAKSRIAVTEHCDAFDEARGKILNPKGRR